MGLTAGIFIHTHLGRTKSIFLNYNKLLFYMPPGTRAVSKQVNYSDEILPIEEKQESYQKAFEDMASVNFLSP